MMKKVMMLSVLLAFVVSAVRAQSLEDGLRAIDAEQYAKAKGIMSNLVKVQPKKGINYFYLGYAHLLNGNLDSAKTVFNQGMTAEPKMLTNNVGLAVAEYYAGNITEAEAQYKELTSKLKKKNYLEFFIIGRSYIDAPTKDYAKAVQYLGQAELRMGKKKDARVFLAKGDAYLAAGQNNPAYVNFQEAVDLDPQLVRAPLNQAVIMRASFAWDEAISSMKNLAEQHPTYAPVYRTLAETYNMWSYLAQDTIQYRERNETAVDYYRQFMDLTDYSVESRIRYSDFLIFAKNYTELQKQAAELSKVENINPKIYRYLGYSHYNKQEYTEAIQALKTMFDKMDPELYISRDYLHLGLSQVFLATQTETVDQATFDAGLAQVKKAVELDVANADDLQNIALAQVENNNYEGAYKLFQISGNTPEARNKATDTYYFGYYAYLTNVNARVDDETFQPDATLLQQIDDAFAATIVADSTIVEAYRFRALNRAFMEQADGIGSSEPYFIKYYEVAQSKGGEVASDAKLELIDTYNKWAHLAFEAQNYDKAKEFAGKTLVLDPSDEYAQQVIDVLGRINNSR